MPRTHLINEQLNALAGTLGQRSEVILQAWRAAADSDARLTTGNSLPQSQFNDHVPHVLQSFGRKLRSWPNDVS
ncbi:MAG: hypothetical protein H0V16_00630, partial [Burkholderiaceae bacterium]|nr:hypothetical protein [Burkholderiaceae bacterium]